MNRTERVEEARRRPACEDHPALIRLGQLEIHGIRKRRRRIAAGNDPAQEAQPVTRDKLLAALQDVWAAGEPWLVLGGGSNLLAGDEPFEGTVVLVRTSGIERLADAGDGRVRLRVEAGHDWDDLVEYTVAAGLAGIEAMSGIPGSAGAAPIQNVGAYGQEIVETLVEVELLDEATGEIEVVSAADLELGFRTSVLKQHYGRGALRSGVIVSITLELHDVGHGEVPVRGGQLRQALRSAGAEATIETRRGIGYRLVELKPGEA